MAEHALSVSGLSLAFGRRSVLSDVSFDLEPGVALSICGPSGSGKTSILNVVLGLVKPAAGAIVVAGHRMTGTSSSMRASIRRTHVGTVFQHSELLPQLTPAENVALPLLLGRKRHALRSAVQLLDRLGVEPRSTATSRLSGGERQRVALARALITQPALVLADEPTGSLDATTREEVADILFDAPTQWGCSLLVVTHEEAVAQRAAKVADIKECDLVFR